MQLDATKDYSVIMSLLESLEENIETEIAKFQKEFSEKYSLDISREIMEYTTGFLKMKINLMIRDIIKDFDWYSVVIDCSEVNLNMYEIEGFLRQAKRKIKDAIPKDPAIDEFQIVLKKYIRKAIVKVPTKWTQPVVLQFLKEFENTLNQIGIVIS